jgi:hypothetical protein
LEGLLEMISNSVSLSIPADKSRFTFASIMSSPSVVLERIAREGRLTVLLLTVFHK